MRKEDLNGLPNDIKGRLGYVDDPSSIEAQIAAGWPQTTSPEEWDEIPVQVVGKVQGNIRITRSENEIVTKRENEVSPGRPKRTRFVQVIDQDGIPRMQRFKQSFHGEWDDLPVLGSIEEEVAEEMGIHPDIIRRGILTPSELNKYLEGVGVEESHTQARRFDNERKKKGGASKTDWKSDSHPSLKKRRLDSED